MAYFKYFPKIAYDVRGVDNNEQYDAITNLLSRVPGLDGSVTLEYQ